MARIARSAERGEAVILGSITNTWNVEARNHETARSPLSVLEKFVGLDLRLVVDSPALLQWLTLLGELDRQNAVEITYVVREEDPVQVAQGLAVVRTLAEQGIWVRLAVRLGSREPRDIDALFEKACSAGACDIELFGESAALWSDEARRLRLRWSLPVVPSGRG